MTVATRLLTVLVVATTITSSVRANDIAGFAFGFDGVDDLVTVPYDGSLDMTAAVTAEAWVLPFAPDGGVVGVWGVGGLDDKFLLYLDNWQPKARIVRNGFPGTTEITGPPLAPALMAHLAMTYDGATLRLYVNAVEVASAAAAGVLATTVGRPLRMGIKNIIVGQEEYLFGSIDEVRVWDVARTATELDVFMNQTVAPDATGLVGSWRANGAIGSQVVVDESTKGNDGTLGADAAVAADDAVRIASIAPMRWEYLGNALAGTLGEPRLSGDGTLNGGTIVILDLKSANPGASAALVIGFSAIYAPLKGGILVPDNDLIFFGLPVNAVGELSVTGIWPLGVPPRVDFWFQFWIPDGAGPVGFAASNGLRGETP